MSNNNTQTDRFWTIPNILSILRIFLILPIVNLLKTNTPESNFYAFIFIALAYFTDFLDGYLARVLNCTSKVGQILDPIGDKLLAITVAAVLYIGKKMPFYLLILIFVRDLIISLGAIYAMNSKKMIMLPLLSGKITTFFLGVVLGFYPLKYSFIMNYQPWGTIISKIVCYGTYLVSGLLILSGILYTANYFRSFLNQRRSNLS